MPPGHIANKSEHIGKSVVSGEKGQDGKNVPTPTADN